MPIVPCRRALACLLFIQLCSLGSAEVILSLRFLSYDNSVATLSNGKCCDPVDAAFCNDACDPVFTVGAAPTEAEIDMDNASKLGGFKNVDNFDFSDMTLLMGQSNPVEFKMDSWQGSAAIRVDVDDMDDGSSPQIVDVLLAEVTQTTPSKNQTTSLSVTGTRDTNPTILNLEVLVYCEEGYYGPSCEVTCAQVDDCSGHYTCDPDTGAKVCLDGWMGGDCSVRMPGFDDCPLYKIPNVSFTGKWKGIMTCGSQILSIAAHLEVIDSEVSGTVGVSDGTDSGTIIIDGLMGINGDYLLSFAGWEGPEPTGLLEYSFKRVTLDETSDTLSGEVSNGGDCTDILLTRTSDFCQNEGTCWDDGSDVQCCCSSGFEGDQCETESDPCSPNPCNLGTCTKINGTTYTCVCPFGYHGDDCEVVGAEVSCSDNPCNSGGCQDSPSGFVCSCPVTDEGENCGEGPPAPCIEFYYGDDCEVFCKPTDSCDGHYTCDTSGTKVCIDGWTGEDCSERDFTESGEDPECPPGDTCRNGGVCFNQTCCCPPDTEGELCEIDMREDEPTTPGSEVPTTPGSEVPTTPGPLTTPTSDLPTTPEPTTPQSSVASTAEPGCEPVDSCDGHYTCDAAGTIICDEGWTGDNCTDRDFQGTGSDPECPDQGSVCRNGGTCFNNACCCVVGFVGELCGTEVNECNSQPCQNGGTCKDELAGYVCVCATGYTGRDCESSMSTTQTAPTTTSNFIQIDPDVIGNLFGNLDGLSNAQIEDLFNQIVCSLTKTCDSSAAVGSNDPSFVAAAALPSRSGSISRPDGGKINYETYVFTGMDGSQYTSIKLSLVLSNGTVITFNNTDVEEALSGMFGIVLPSNAIQNGPLLLNENRFQLKVIGQHLDLGLLPLVESALSEAYKVANPDFQTNDDFRVMIPNSEEIFGQFDHVVATLFNHWLITGPNENQDQATTDTVTIPSDDVILEKFADFNLTWNLFTEEGFHSIFDTFSIFVDAKFVIDTDFENFERVIREAWLVSYGDFYPDITIEIVKSESYIVTGKRETVTRLSYLAKSAMVNADSGLIAPTTPTVMAPTETTVQTFVDFDLSSGEPVRMVVNGSETFKDPTHTTSSISGLVRKIEAFSVYCEDRVLASNLDSMVQPITDVILTVPEFANVTVEIIGYEEFFAEVNMTSFSRIYYTLTDTNTGRLVDSRRVGSIMPSLADIAAALTSAAIEMPNGQQYTWISDIQQLGLIVSREECFAVIIEGSLPITDLPNFETTLSEILLELNSELSTQFDSCSAVVMHLEERITEDGEIVIVMHYTIKTMLSDYVSTVRSTISDANVVDAQLLTSALNFTRVDGTPYTFANLSLLANLPRADSMLPVFTLKKVASEDFAKMAIAYQDFLSTRTDMTITYVEAVMQQELVTSYGETVFCLSMMVYDSNNETVPEAAIRSFTYEEMALTFDISDRFGVKYDLFIDEDEVENLLSLDAAFKFVFNTPIAQVNFVDLEQLLAVSFTESFSDYEGFEVKLYAVQEYTSINMSTYFVALCRLTVEGEVVSSMTFPSPDPTLLTINIAQMISPNGVAYEYVENVTFADLFCAASFSSVTMKRPILMSDYSAVEAIVLTQWAEILEVSNTSLEVMIVRQREMVDITTGELVWSCDFSISLEGDVLFPSMVPFTQVSTQISREITNISVEYKLLTNISMESVIQLSNCFSLLFESSVLPSTYSDITKIIIAQLKTLSQYSGLTISVDIALVEEVLTSETKVSMFELRYFVNVDDLLLLPSVDIVASTTNIASAVTDAAIEGPRGPCVVIEAPSAYIRLSSMLQLTMNGQISTSDLSYMSILLQQYIRVLDPDFETAVLSIVKVADAADINGRALSLMYCTFELDGSIVLPGFLPRMDISMINQFLTIITDYAFRSQYSVSDIELSRVFRLSDLFSFQLSRSILPMDIAKIQTGFASMFSSRTGFLEADIEVVILNQMESYSLTNEKVVEVSFGLFVNGEFLPSTMVTEIQPSEIEIVLGQILLGSTMKSYADFIVMNADVLWRFEDLGAVTFTSEISENYYAQLALMIQASFTEKVTGSVDVQIIRGEPFYRADGQMVWCYFFSVEVDGVPVPPFDLPNIPFESLQTAVADVSLCGDDTDVSEDLIDNTAEPLTRRGSLFNALTFSERIQLTDTLLLADAVGEAYLEYIGATTNVSVDVEVVDQTEVVDANQNTAFVALMQITVDGQVAMTFDGLIDVILPKLSNLTVTGTIKTLASLVTDSAEAVSTTELYSLTFESAVPSDLSDGFSAKVSETLQTQFGISSTVATTITKQEAVLIESQTMFRVFFSVDVDGAALDSCLRPKIDYDALVAAIAADATLSAQIQVSTMSQDELSAALPLAFIQELCFENKLTISDIDRLISLTEDSISAIDDEFANLVVEPLGMIPKITSDNKRVHCFQYAVEIEGRVVSQSVDISILQTLIENYRTSSGDLFILALESDLNILLPESMAFSVVFNTKVGSADIAALMTALQTKWAAKLGEAVELRFVLQEEMFSPNGELVIDLTYFVTLSGSETTIDAATTSALTVAELTTIFSTVQVSRLTTTTFYSEFVYAGDVALLVKKTDLCMVVIQQRVSDEYYADFNSAITEAWQMTDTNVTGLVIDVIAQERIIVAYSYVATSMYYKATDGDDNLQLCMDFDFDFLAALEATFDVKAPTGEPYTLLTSLTLSQVMEQNKAYEFVLSQVIATADIEAIEVALETKWNTEFSQTVSVHIAIQEEYINANGEIMWKVFFYVENAELGLLDSGVDAGLDVTMITAALSTVTVTLDTSVTYSDYLFTASMDLIFSYDFRFGLNLFYEIEYSLIDDFKTVLLQVWTAERPSLTSLDIYVVKQEEVVDENRMSAFQLVYFVMDGNRLIDPLTEFAISEDIFQSAVLQANIDGPNGAYLVKTGLQLPLFRVDLSFSLFVKGSVRVEDYELFSESLYSVWKEEMTNVEIFILRSEEYVYERQFATGLSYFLTLDGVVIAPTSVPVVSLTDIIAEIDFVNVQNEVYEVLLNVTDVYRYRVGFSAYLEHVIKTSDMEQIIANLEAKWEEELSTSGIKVVSTFQEEMCTSSLSSSTYWKLVYFMEINGEIMNSNLVTAASEASLQSIFDVQISGYTEKYNEFLVSAEIAADLLRINFLFEVPLLQKASVTQYEQFVEIFVQAWHEREPEFTQVDVTILKQQLFISDLGEFVHKLYFSTKVNGTILRSSEFTSFTLEELSGLSEMTTPRGGAYEIYDLVGRSLLDYRSAFNILMSRPVLSMDQDFALTNLKAKWKEANPDIEASIDIRYGNQQEYLDSNGQSAYKFNYFVTSKFGLVNALFEDTLSVDIVIRALHFQMYNTDDLYSEFLLVDTTDSLISFNDLIGVPFVSKVSVTDYEKIQKIIQTAWVETSDTLTSLVVTILTQEEYLYKGEFYSMVLCSASLGGQPLTIEDLPDLPLSELTEIEDIPSQTGEPYELSDVEVSELRRLKMAMNIVLDKWVSRTDQVILLNALRAKFRTRSIEFATLDLEFATIETYIYNDEFVYDFAFFVTLGKQIIDASFEPSFGKQILQNAMDDNALDYVVIDNEIPSDANNLRYSFTIFVESFITEEDQVLFKNALQTFWQARISSSTVEIVANEIYTSSNGKLLTGCSYFVIDKDGYVIDPETIVHPTQSELQESITIVAYDGSDYLLFFGKTVLYAHQYTTSVTGDVFPDVAQEALDALKTVWTSNLESTLPELGDVSVELVMLEKAFAEFGNTVTNIRYKVSINDQVTFPGNDPGPRPEDLIEVLSEADLLVTPYEGPEPIKDWQLFSVVLNGEVAIDEAQSLMTALEQVWDTEVPDLVSPVFEFRGRKLVSSVTGSSVNTQVLYSVKSDGKLVPTTQGPSANSLQAVIKSVAKLDLNVQPTLTMRSVLLRNKLTSDDLISSFIESVKAAWTAVQDDDLGEVTVYTEASTQEIYATAQWTKVFKVNYFVAIGGKDASSSNAVEPGYEALQSALEEEELGQCGCKASKAYQLFVENADASKSDQIRRALKTAWTKANAEIDESMFSFSLNAAAKRRRRDNHGESNTTYTDGDGNQLAPVDYTVDVAEQSPNGFFVSEPTDAELATALADEGVESCVEDCEPQRCSSLFLLGSLEDSERAAITDAIVKAFLEANPGVTAEQISVNITNVENGLKDNDDNAVVDVSYCVKRLDEEALNDIADPNENQLSNALAEAGKTLVGSDDVLEEETDEGKEIEWVLIVVIVCAVFAIIIVMLAVVKVVHRRREQEVVQKGGILGDEEDFAPHAPYNATMSSYPSSTFKNGDTVNSRIGLYDNQGLNYA